MKTRFQEWKIQIEDSVVVVMESFRQNAHSSKEAGGILLGEVYPELNKVVVSKITTPNSKDKRKRYGFVRAVFPAQVIIDYEYLNSGQRTIYLGEWHTHAESKPTPSSRDRMMIKDQFENGQLTVEFLLLVIQGTSGRYVGAFQSGTLSPCT
ncbi:MAG: Mov34/MPN/PAD-1 family protein [bacterium]|nr:Mov34/MPN/PAD-1 family protein [bacterium]